MERKDHFLVHAGEAEHADLIGDMLPVLGRALFGEQIAQLLSHADYPVRHRLHVFQPASAVQQTYCTLHFVRM